MEIKLDGQSCHAHRDPDVLRDIYKKRLRSNEADNDGF